MAVACQLWSLLRAKELLDLPELGMRKGKNPSQALKVSNNQLATTSEHSR